MMWWAFGLFFVFCLAWTAFKIGTAGRRDPAPGQADIGDKGWVEDMSHDSADADHG
jgi:hypothetical protein